VIIVEESFLGLYVRIVEDSMNIFTLSVPLYVNPYAYKKLGIKFNVAHHIYNAVLGECERRKKKYINSPNYIQAQEKYKLNLKSEYKILYAKAEADSKYTENNIVKFVQSIRNKSWLEPHINANETNQLARRAFQASYKTLGWIKGKDNYKKAKVKFKRFGKDYIYSLDDGGSNSSSFKLKNIVDHPKLVWQGVELPLIVKSNDQVAIYCLSEKVKRKNIRIKRKLVNNKWNYFVDITCEGEIYNKPKNILGSGVVGIDIGPSSIAYISDTKCKMDNICNIKQDIDLRKDIQRKITRLRIRLNPDKYNDNGTNKLRTQYKTKWISSHRLKELEKKYSEVRRKNKESRRNSHGIICNEIRSLGDYLKVDKDSYKEWQSSGYGKSLENHSPGLLTKLLENKFNYTKGKFEAIDTKNSKSSQRCPNCGNIKKKELKDRIHTCQCGFEYQRDLTSAIVNKFYNTELNSLNVNEANNFIMGKQSILSTCIKELIQSVHQNRKFVVVAGTIPELQQIVAKDEVNTEITLL